MLSRNRTLSPPQAEFVVFVSCLYERSMGISQRGVWSMKSLVWRQLFPHVEMIRNLYERYDDGILNMTSSRRSCLTQSLRFLILSLTTFSFLSIDNFAVPVNPLSRALQSHQTTPRLPSQPPQEPVSSLQTPSNSSQDGSPSE